MKIHVVAALALAAASLAACGGKGDDTLASNVEAVGENQADMLEANGSEAMADAVEENAEDRAEAIDDADVNTESMTGSEKAAVANGSATVQ